MRRLVVLTALGLGGCLTRTNLGQEPADAGCETCPLGDAAGAETPREIAIGQFVQMLTDKPWRGEVRDGWGRRAEPIQLEFRLDGSYVVRCDGRTPDATNAFLFGLQACDTSAEYLITDYTLNEEFWATTTVQNGDNTTHAYLKRMWISPAGDRMSFRYKEQAFENQVFFQQLEAEVVLERAP